jgi:hypothetical protein
VTANQTFDGQLKIAACFLERAWDESFKRRSNLKNHRPPRQLRPEGNRSEIILRCLKYPGTHECSMDAAIQDKVLEHAIETEANLVKAIHAAALPVKNRVFLLLDPSLDSGLELQSLLPF